MPTYSEIIRQQRKRLPREINWWPSYLYHYTDVHNAVGILEKEWLYDRKTAEAQHLAKTDAASRNVLEVTGDDIKHCARLYMRPLTPTQYYSEGYKPEAARHKDYKETDCPVAIFFLFDAVRTLSYPGVCFLEKGGAHRRAGHPGARHQAQLQQAAAHGGLGLNVADAGALPHTEGIQRGIHRSPLSLHT